MELLSTFSSLTIAITAGILVLTVYFHGPAYCAHVANYAPATLTSLGIFGTFLGVALGLFEFDIKNIQASVPNLLLGLKTAFWSSVVGLAGALSIKVRQLVTFAKRKERRQEGDHIHSLVSLTHDTLNELTKFRNASLKKQHSFEKNTLESINRLSGSIENYFGQMVEINTNALIEALETVMRDFNGKINEQYGENFKQLNMAVGKMVSWQQQYRTQLTELCQQFSALNEKFSEASNSFSKLAEGSRAFKLETENISLLIEQISGQRALLESHIEKFAAIIDQTDAGLPRLENRMIAITGLVTDAVEKSSQVMNATVNSTCNSLEDNLTNVLKNLSDTIGTMQEEIVTQTQASMSRLEKQSVELDRAMEEELTKALRTFGYQLTALSEKFVDDYTPLTEKLRNVLQIAS